MKGQNNGIETDDQKWSKSQTLQLYVSVEHWWNDTESKH
jgi:hypothetical protein